MKQILILFLAVVSQTTAEIFQTKQTDITSDICDSKPNWSLIPHPSDCERFYVCVNRILEEYSCIKNYHFDHEQKRCVRGSCTSSIVERECPKNAIRRVNGNCHLYEVCHSIGNYTQVSCPKGSYFVESLGVCIPIPTNLDTPQYKCSCTNESYKVFKNSDDCGSFYLCIDGKIELQKCRSGDFFNEHLNACVQDLEGVCSKTQHIIDAGMLEICSINSYHRNNDLQFPLLYSDMRSCNSFFLCINGRVILKRCPDGFYFNRKKSICEADITGLFCKEIEDQIIYMLETKRIETFINKVISQNTKKLANHNVTGWNVTNNEKFNVNQVTKPWKITVPPNVISNNIGYENGSLKRPHVNKPIRYETKLPTNSNYKKLSSKFTIG